MGGAAPGLAAEAGSAKQAFAAPATVSSSRGTGILVDAIHANDFSTIGLNPGGYEYHHIAGCRFGLEYLKARGVRCDRASEGRLDARRLADYRLLFINLVSAERPPFLVSEIAAIRSFVAGGGSLLVVTDHTNAYFHAHVLVPLLTELDVASFTCTVCDDAPHTLGCGNGWIAVTRFNPHPVTLGLKCIGLQTGGRVDDRFAVALSSERSWADAWRTGPYGEVNAPGFFGNFRRDPGEKCGPLGVVLAKEYGSGRIVIVADQNLLSDTFINYADNWRLWLNATAWLLGDDRLRATEPYERWRKPQILMVEQYDHAAFGASESAGCYHAWVLLSRHFWCFANDRFLPSGELIVIAYNDAALPPHGVAAIVKHLRSGRNVLVLNSEMESLLDASNAVGQILGAAGIRDSKRQTRPGKLILELPGAGAIHVLGPDQVLDNRTIASPTKVPSAAAEERNKMLLNAVRDALPNSSPPKSAH